MLMMNIKKYGAIMTFAVLGTLATTNVFAADQAKTPVASASKENQSSPKKSRVLNIYRHLDKRGISPGSPMKQVRERAQKGNMPPRRIDRRLAKGGR